MIEGIFIVLVSWYLIQSQEQSAGAWWLSLNENEINGKQVGTSKADCSNGMTKCACNHQPQLLYLCHGGVKVRVVNGSNYLILETVWSKSDKGERDTDCGSALPPVCLYDWCTHKVLTSLGSNDDVFMWLYMWRTFLHTPLLFSCVLQQGVFEHFNWPIFNTYITEQVNALK